MEGVLRKGRLLVGGAVETQRGGEKLRQLLGLTASMVRIGLIGFGGGNALIPVIEAEVVKNRRLISPAAYQEDVVAASITPGALPVEIAAGTGQRVAGSFGMILAAVAMALPGAALLVAILSVLSGETGAVLRDVKLLSIPIGAFIMSLLMLYTVKALRAEASAEGGSFSAALAIVLSIFVLTGEKQAYRLLGMDSAPIFGLSTLAALGLSFFLILFLLNDRSKGRVALAAILSGLFLAAKGKSLALFGPPLSDGLGFFMAALASREVLRSLPKNSARGVVRPFFMGAAKELGAWSVFLALGLFPVLLAVPSMIDFAWRGYFSSLLSFGGGDAYLTIADGLFVATGIVPESAFFALLVPLVNVLPDSILCQMLTGLGFVIGSSAGGPGVGLLGALAGFAVSVSGSGMLFGFVARLIRTFQEQRAFQAISRWVRPIIGGLLINVALALLSANLKLAGTLGLSPALVIGVTVLVLAAALYMLLVKRWQTLRPMGFAGLVGLVMILVF